MAGNDFYLQFTSNAEAFSKSIGGELSPGVEQINQLTQALLRYDETVGGMRAGNPLGGLFTQLDQASSKLEGIGDQISSQFAKITTSLGRLSADLTEALEVVSRAAGASRTAATRAPKVNAQGYTDEQQRIIDSQRRGTTAAAAVHDDELSPAKIKQTQSTLAKATTDGDAARNAVKRVADINATLARNANDGADALKNLGQAIRTLTVQTKTTTKGVTEGRFQQNNIILQGGAGAGHVQIDPQQIQTVLAAAGVQEAQQAPARDAAHQAQRDAAEAKQRATTLERSQFNVPARPGSYLVPGETQPRIVSNRINPGETFEGYFGRTAANTAGLAQVRKDVVTGSEQRVGIQSSRNLQTIQQLIGRRGLEQLAGDEKLRQAYRTPGSVPTETIRASVGSVLSPGQALTPEQYGKVPEALAEFQKMQEDFAKAAHADAARRIAENPNETFAFAPEARRQDVFGSVGDYRAQVSRYDVDNPEGPGAAYRAQAESVVAGSKLDRQAQVGAYRDFAASNASLSADPDVAARQEAARRALFARPTQVIGDTGREPNAGRDTTAEYDAMVEQAKTEARAAGTDQREAAADLKEAASELKAASGGGGGRPPRPPRAGSISEQPEEEPEGEGERPATNLQRTVANRQGRVDRLQANYEQAISHAAAQYEDLGDFNPESHEEVIQAEQQLKGAERRLARAQEQLAAVTEEEVASTASIQPFEVAPADRGTPGRRVRPSVRGMPFDMTPNVTEFEQSLHPDTRAAIAAERGQIGGLSGADFTASMERAATALRGDPAFGSLGGVSAQRRMLATLTQAPRGPELNRSLSQVYAVGGGTSAVGAVGGAGAGGAGAAEATRSAADEAASLERLVTVIERTTGASKEMQRAQLALYQAQEKVNDAVRGGVTSGPKLAAAQQQLLAAQGGVQRVAKSETAQTLQQKMFGQAGFGQGQLRHIGLGLENTIGYTLVFEGLDKLKELVHDGLEAEAAFTRLQASLKANGISAEGLRSSLQNISAETATPLEKVTEAASELSGTLKNTGDLEFGTKVAAELANISQGTLTATEAAVGLRDVVAAYGDQWSETGLTVQQGLKQTGDDIARLSQLTGVNVKDITEGTTQIASEARDFGLNQRQASTIAAYVAQGTGETGEQSASQTSRLLSGLYNSRTQQTLQRVLKPTNQQGQSISQQFATGDIGGVLTELIQQYHGLNDANKQAVAGMLGTGIQARAFAALIGGGANAVKALNGELEDNGALDQQNKTYLQTIAGEIKRLDEDFQNFGSTLQRIGAFDALGGLAKGLDEVFRLANALFGAISDFADKDYFGIPTKEVLHLAIALGEAAAAYKLFGSPLARGVIGTRLGGRILGGAALSNQGAIAAAAVAGQETPKARYAFSSLARQAGRTRLGVRPDEEFAAQRKAEKDAVRKAEQDAVTQTTADLDLMSKSVVGTTEALGALTGAAQAAAVGESEVAATSSTVAAVSGTSVIRAAEQGALFPIARGGFQPTLPFGASAAGAAETGAVAATASEGQMVLPLAFRSPSTGRFASPSSVVTEDAERTAAAEGGLPGMSRQELLAAQNVGSGKLAAGVGAGAGAGLGEGELAAGALGAGTLLGGSGEAAAANKLGLLGRGIPKLLGKVPGVAGTVGEVNAGKLFGLANAGGLTGGIAGASGVLPGLAVAYVGTQYLKGADQEEGSRNTSAGKLLAGGTNIADVRRLEKPRSFLDQTANTGPLTNNIPVLHTLGQAGNIIFHANESLLNAIPGVHLGGGGGGPSDASNNAYFKLFDQTVGGFAKGSAGAKAAAGHETIKGELPKLTTVDQVTKFQKAVTKNIEDQRDKIQKAGGNDKQAQAQIAYDITNLETTLTTAAAHRIAAIKGLNSIDLLNAQQVTDLNTSLGQLASLSPSTIKQNPEAIRNLINSGTVPIGSKAYRDLEAAGGLNLYADHPNANVVGRTPTGQYGYYDEKGKFHSELRQDVLGGGGPNGTQGSGIQSTLPTSTPAGAPTIYNPLGLNPKNATPANTLGINTKGQIGSYDASGKFRQYTGYVSPTQAQNLENAPRITPPKQYDKQTYLKALSAGYDQSIKSANITIALAGTKGGISDAALAQAKSALATATQGKQAVQQQLYQNPIGVATGQAQLAQSLSGTGGTIGGVTYGAGTSGAIGLLNQANKALKTYNSKVLDKSDPEFYSNLQQIQQNKVTIAQLSNQNAQNVLALAAASTNDQVSKANIAYKQAQLTLSTDTQAGASLGQIGQDKAAVAAAGLGQQQAAQNVTTAQFQLRISQTRNTIGKAQIGLNQALQAEVTYRQGGLRDKASLLAAEGQEAQARQEISDAIQAQKDSAIESRAALAKFHGNDVGAAEDELVKAEGDYKNAIQQYGKNSQQARDAYTNVITQKSSLYDTVTTQITSGLDLEVQELNARGVGQGSDLGQAAAAVATQKARAELNRYQKKGGKKGTAQYDQLYGQVIAAQRSQFDTALNAQLDTLDFQQQTYQITGAQEIASLQQILKNKQLTLAEQRSITLKIKSLQDGIREQLTSGGLNIPSDIKLPTAYEVRRSLGAGFTGSATKANVVNNNQQASITVNQTLPTSAMAKAVATQVITLINQQTGQQVRANSSSPRTVPVGKR